MRPVGLNQQRSLYNNCLKIDLFLITPLDNCRSKSIVLLYFGLFFFVLRCNGYIEAFNRIKLFDPPAVHYHLNTQDFVPVFTLFNSVIGWAFVVFIHSFTQWPGYRSTTDPFNNVNLNKRC